MNILVAEDEKDIRNLLKLELEQEGYSVFASKDGLEAFEVMQNNEIDLAILDVMMPRLDGFNLLRKIRLTSNLPVIFLTARGDDMDKILGLGIGADDYLVKPFSMVELLARVSAQLRRNLEYASQKVQVSTKIECGSLCLDMDACCVYKDNVFVALNAKEYLLLKYLMQNMERFLLRSSYTRQFGMRISIMMTIRLWYISVISEIKLRRIQRIRNILKRFGVSATSFINIRRRAYDPKNKKPIFSGLCSHDYYIHIDRTIFGYAFGFCR